MPRYFFDVFDGKDIIDDVSTELPNLAAAQVEAVRASTELLLRHNASFWTGEPWTMKVREGAKVVAELSFVAKAT